MRLEIDVHCFSTDVPRQHVSEMEGRAVSDFKTAEIRDPDIALSRKDGSRAFLDSTILTQGVDEGSS